MSDGEIPPLNDGSASTPRDGAASAVPAPIIPIIPVVTDRIVDLDIDRELHESYLTYAMSTIMDRALPDVRDGLKPSQRSSAQRFAATPAVTITRTARASSIQRL